MIDYPRLEALRRKSTMEIVDGRLDTWSYLLRIDDVAEGDRAQQAFFAYGDSQGFTPGVLVTDYIRPKPHKGLIALGIGLAVALASLGLSNQAGTSTIEVNKPTLEHKINK